jgi:hypothetical protein
LFSRLYLAGSCQDKPATVYATSFVLALSAYVGVHILQGLSHDSPPSLPAEEEDGGGSGSAVSSALLRPKEQRKVLLLLATFATAITYVAGLNLPGGFWDTFDDVLRRGGDHGYRYSPGESLVEAHHGGHLRMFFYCNTTAFVASLFVIVLLLHPDKKNKLTASSSVSWRPTTPAAAETPTAVSMLSACSVLFWHSSSLQCWLSCR